MARPMILWTVLLASLMTLAGTFALNPPAWGPALAQEASTTAEVVVRDTWRWEATVQELEGIARRPLIELNGLYTELARRRWLDSLAARLDEAAGTGRVRVFAPDGLVDETVAASLAARVPAPSDRRAEDATIVLALIDREAAAAESRSWPNDVEFFMEPGPDGPRCFVLRYYNRSPAHFRAEAVLRRAQLADWTGPCGAIARFGEPGPRIRAWLDAGAWELVRWWRPAAPRDGEREPRAVRDLRLAAQPAAKACLAGRDDACRSLLFPASGSREWRLPDAESRAPLRPVGLASVGLPGRIGLGWTLLADLARDSGDDAFARFWRSADDPAPAFAAAFGITPEAWLRSAYLRRYDAIVAGPAPRPLSAGLSLLACLACAAVAAALGRRRVVA